MAKPLKPNSNDTRRNFIPFVDAGQGYDLPAFWFRGNPGPAIWSYPGFDFLSPTWNALVRAQTNRQVVQSVTPIASAFLRYENPAWGKN